MTTARFHEIEALLVDRNLTLTQARELGLVTEIEVGEWIDMDLER